MSIRSLPRNLLLESLSPHDGEMLRPHLRLVELTDRAVLIEAGKPIQRVYFPHSGVVSLVANFANGQSVDVAMIGCDSVCGVSAALGDRVAWGSAIVRLPGAASVLDADRLRFAANESAQFRDALLLHEEALLAQVEQSGACNAVHGLEPRLAGRLLRMRDLSGDDTLHATQELLAEMLGVQRNSVSIIAKAFQQAKLIRYRRGAIEIVNLEGLKASACECYRAVETHYQRLSQGDPKISARFALRTYAPDESPVSAVAATPSIWRREGRG
ncbi:MAG: Crp/Fnr family transcriptional regulator [Roseiarcus sp.]